VTRAARSRPVGAGSRTRGGCVCRLGHTEVDGAGLDFRASGRFQYSTGIGYYWFPEEEVNGLGLGWAGLGWVHLFALLIHDIGGGRGLQLAIAQSCIRAGSYLLFE
jgi:hypothetical protein